MPAPNSISIEELSREIGTRNAPVVIDVCIDEDYELDPRLIPTAIRRSHKDIRSWAENFHAQELVVICQKGLKLSMGAAAFLRSESINARYLIGGNHAWRDAGLPLIPAKQFSLDHTQPSLWVTRSDGDTDAMTCAWLIRRFVDRKAKFLFVETEQVEAVAEKYDAIPFAIPDVFWSAEGGNSAFDKMLGEFDLETKPLQQLAKLAEMPDQEGCSDLMQINGLCVALAGSRQVFDEEIARLDASLLIFDSFYMWLRNVVKNGDMGGDNA